MPPWLRFPLLSRACSVYWLLFGVSPIARTPLIRAPFAAQIADSQPGRTAVNVRFLATAAAALSLIAYAAPSRAQSSQDNVSACAQSTDPENLCNWDSPAGTHGRKCNLDVENIPRTPCTYGQSSIPAITDHKPMCFSVQNAEHIAFMSGQGRSFRVRRLVPITHKNASGLNCPRDPFATAFDPSHMAFGNGADSHGPQSSAIGCQYKLEVQFQTEDPNAPADPDDPSHRHYECRDPHLKIVN